MNEKLVTVVIPAYHATKHITDALSSIQIQTIVDKIKVIISVDDTTDDYSFTKKEFPKLDITILKCEKNGGPGVARQRGLDACDTEWVTFIDADDVFFTPLSLEALLNGAIKDVIEVQGTFFQEVNDGPNGERLLPRNDVGHPWVFGRLYNVPFLRQSGIGFSNLRAMEDGELNWKIRLSIENSPLHINVIDTPVYLWRVGSEHSITRIGVKENGGVPLYNWDLCLVGSTAASINAIKFSKKKNPFNGNINKFTVEMMIGQYFSYVQCLERKPLFAKQCLFNAKRFYNACYKDIENQIDDEVLKNMYTFANMQHSQDMIGIIPQITFFDFMKQIKEQEFKGKAEWEEIRSELPDWVIELDKKSGVLGEEGYIPVFGEE